MEQLSLLMVDDHVQVRTLILQRLAREAAFEIVGLTDNSHDAVSCATTTHPRVVLIDPMLSDGKGLDAIRSIRTLIPEAAIVVLTAFTDTAQKIELEKLGVHYILNKGIESYKLIAVLHAACDEGAPPSVNHSVSTPTEK